MNIYYHHESAAERSVPLTFYPCEATKYPLPYRMQLARACDQAGNDNMSLNDSG